MLRADLLTKNSLEQELTDAITNQEFQLIYQPKIDLRTGKMKGVEALIRWEHPLSGTISPVDFIPMAEETGVICPIGEWVLRTACKQAMEWIEAGLPPLIMAVNLSARQLYQADIVEMIQGILKETGLRSDLLELEITESLLMDVHSVLPIIKELKTLGVKISLDDFGTGYSSLSYLKEFPIDIIKIDQSFVRNCQVDTKDATIIKAIIAMAHQLNMEVIAEGIETKEQLIFLQQNLCNKGQGFLFSKPVTATEISQKFYEIEQIVSQQGIPLELSKQRMLEEALEQARQELRDTMRNQQGMIFKFVERDGRFIHTLCDGELLYRIGLTPEQLIGRELYDVFPLTEAESSLQFYRRAWEGEDVTYEGQVNDVWYLASLHPIRKGGQVTEVIASCVDITKRIESDERYQKLVEYSPKAIVVHQDDTILYANQSALTMLKSDRLIGDSIYQYLHSNWHDQYKERSAQAVVGKELPLFEAELVRQDGIVIKADFWSVRIPFNGRSAILCFFSDETERKNMDIALRQSEEMYRLITEHTQDLISVLDRTGVVQFASPSHETRLGLKPESFKGTLVFDRVHPNDISSLQMRFSQMIDFKAPCRIEFRYKHAQDVWVQVEAYGTPVLDEQGDVKQVVVVARDVSKPKRSKKVPFHTEQFTQPNENRSNPRQLDRAFKKNGLCSTV